MHDVCILYSVLPPPPPPPPHTHTHTHNFFESKVGRGHFIEYSISVAHTNVRTRQGRKAILLYKLLYPDEQQQRWNVPRGISQVRWYYQPKINCNIVSARATGDKDWVVPTCAFVFRRKQKPNDRLVTLFTKLTNLLTSHRLLLLRSYSLDVPEGAHQGTLNESNYPRTWVVKRGRLYFRRAGDYW